MIVYVMIKSTSNFTHGQTTAAASSIQAETVTYSTPNEETISI